MLQLHLSHLCFHRVFTCAVTVELFKYRKNEREAIYKTVAHTEQINLKKIILKSVDILRIN